MWRGTKAFIRGRPRVIAVLIATAACGVTATHQDPVPPGNRPHGSRSLVGRWALVSLVINGEDRTNRSVTTASAVVYYTFSADGRFRIVHGDSVSETGAWSVDTTMSPAYFDHIPDVDGKPGLYVPGIYAINGDTLRISIVAPNSARRHPTQFRSSPADGSWLLVLRRAAP